MQITIISHDNSVKMVDITNPRFLEDVSKDKYLPTNEKSVLFRTCHTLSLDCKTFFKTGNTSIKLVPNKGCIAEKLPKKMRVKNSNATTSELAALLASHILSNKKYNAINCGALKLSGFKGNNVLSTN